MSFILDALKKSELERQRQAMPGLTDTRLGPRHNRLPLWAVALGILLVINLLVLSFALLRKATPATPSPPRAAVVTPAPQAPAATKHFSPLDAAPVYAPEIPVNATPEEPDTANSKAADHPDPLLTAEDNAPDEQEVLPSINEMSLSGSQLLPEMHLDVHVYATKPSERFVYINMRKYHEGAKLQEGPTVEHIRRDGVVLNYQGLRFIVPRQQ